LGVWIVIRLKLPAWFALNDLSGSGAADSPEEDLDAAKVTAHPGLGTVRIVLRTRSPTRALRTAQRRVALLLEHN
jgi:hypothetical protein